MSWVLVISHTVTGCETVMPCEHTDTFSHILLLIMLSITLSTFPFIWKVPSSVRDACGEWGETGGDSEGHEMCQDRSLAPALCCGQPWTEARESEWKWANHRPRSLPRVLVSIPPHHTRQSHTNGDYSRGFLPSLHGSVALYEKLLLLSWQLPL